MSGSQLLIIYAAIGFFVGIVLASILMDRFTKRRKIEILLAVFVAIGLIYFIHPPTSLGVAYGYPFGVAMAYIFSLGDTTKK